MVLHSSSAPAFEPGQPAWCLCADRTYNCFVEMQWIPWPTPHVLTGFHRSSAAKVEVGLMEANAELLHFYPSCWKHHILSLAENHMIFCQSNVFNSVAERGFMLDVGREKNQP